MTKIKICGIKREVDASYVNESGPDYTGFVFFERSHRNVSIDEAVRLRNLINPSIKTVGVFVNEDISFIEELVEKSAIDIIQLHGNEDEDYIEEVRKRMPGTEIWKAFKVRSEEDLLTAEKSSADMILLDNGYGTGEKFDWSLMGRVVKRDFIMAGGIKAEDIGYVVRTFSPYAIDLSSSVETDRKKDRRKITEAVDALRKIQEA